jgi:hypothetical protein
MALVDLSSVIVEGVYASLPAFGMAGRIYFATDTKQVWYDNGGGWDDVTPALAAEIDIVAFSATPVFDATLGRVFKLTLTGNVISSTFINNTSGYSIVGFRLVQDATGGRAFMWPTNVRNGGVVNPAANARSIQLFVLDTDGSLDAAGPMTYS